MKRLTALLLLLCLLPSLSACSGADDDTVSFYYCRDPESSQYFQPGGVIQAEQRTIVEHRTDLHYLLSLYLAGPTDEGLVSPLPKNVHLLSVSRQDGTIIITITDLSDTLTGADFTLACACLTLTCLDISQCDQVSVVSGSNTVTMSAEDILLSDQISSGGTTKGGNP